MARRNIDVFGLSFLDVMFCGFGSVILLVMLINAHGLNDRRQKDQRLHSEVEQIEEEVLEGRKNLVRIRNSLDQLEQERVRTEGLSRKVLSELQERRKQLADSDQNTLSQREHINQLQSELKQLEQAQRRLQAAGDNQGPEGQRVRAVQGDGERQYLTGLKVGGKHIVFLVDISASMLDETIVDVIRRRNLPAKERLKAPKWRRVVRTVEWLTAQIPPDSQFQMYIFNQRSAPLLPGTGEQWQPAAGGQLLNKAIQRLARVAPSHGTSLVSVFSRISRMQPRPDNVFLLTDGLPTYGTNSGDQARVTGQQRMQYFIEATQLLPTGVPINIILFPLEGDPMAASTYWKLAMQTRGSFISASSDWP